MAARKTGLRATSGKHTLAFGLVRVNVAMGPLFEAEKRVAANYICPDHRERISQVKVCKHPGCDAEAIKAYPFGGAFVELTPHEVPKADGDGIIDLVANVTEADVHAEYVENTYLLWPEDGTQDDGYNLVLHYLRDNGRAFIGTTVAQGTTKAFAVRYSDVTKCLVAQVLNYAANVRWANAEIIEEYLTELGDPNPAMADMGATLFDQLPDTFDWNGVEDEYGVALEAAIEAKAGGKTITAATPQKAVDTGSLMDALKASVAANPTPKVSNRKKVAA